MNAYNTHIALGNLLIDQTVESVEMDDDSLVLTFQDKSQLKVEGFYSNQSIRVLWRQPTEWKEINR